MRAVVHVLGLGSPNEPNCGEGCAVRNIRLENLIVHDGSWNGIYASGGYYQLRTATYGVVDNLVIQGVESFNHHKSGIEVMVVHGRHEPAGPRLEHENNNIVYVMRIYRQIRSNSLELPGVDPRDFRRNSRVVVAAALRRLASILIAATSNLPSARVSSPLLRLELKRLVKQLPGKYFVKLS
jgi:hypothetical protein